MSGRCQPFRVFVLATICLCSPLRAVFQDDARWTETYSEAEILCTHPREEFAEETLLDKVVYVTHSRQPRYFPLSHSVNRIQEEKASQQAILDALEKIYSYELLLSKPMLEQGLSNLGETASLRRVVRKLVAGQPIKVVALGGSVTKGHGPLNPDNSWLNRFYSWLNETFPHPDHQLINQAIPAVTSAYVSPCVLSMVPEDTDLVLLEFTFNDSLKTYKFQLEADSMRGLERLIRKLLRAPRKTGIIYMHYWSGRTLKDTFANTIEDVTNIILKYYGLFGLSMRDSIHQISQNDTLMGQIYHQNWDMYHPTCIGSRFFADLLIGHFQDLAAAEVLELHRAYSENETLNHHRRLHQPYQSLHAWDTPLQQDNWANLTDTCILEDQVKDMVRPGQGFAWTNEGRPGHSDKWGFVAQNPGDNLEIDINLEGVQTVNRELTIGLGFLVSYEHMGMAYVGCKAGCQCLGRKFNFLHPAWELNSITAWKPVDVAIDEGSTLCTLSVLVMNETKSEPPEHKVKLTSVMLTAEKGFIMPCGGSDCT